MWDVERKIRTFTCLAMITYFLNNSTCQWYILWKWQNFCKYIKQNIRRTKHWIIICRKHNIHSISNKIYLKITNNGSNWQVMWCYINAVLVHVVNILELKSSFESSRGVAGKQHIHRWHCPNPLLAKSTCSAINVFFFVNQIQLTIYCYGRVSLKKY